MNMAAISPTSSRKRHGLWLLFTCVAYIAGSILRPNEASVTNAERPVPIELTQSAMVAADEESTTVSTVSSLDESTVASSDPVNGAALKESLLPSSAPIKQQRTLPPLTKEEIEELVMTAIKSTDPIERRKAFDRVLQEIESDSFTKEQAMITRSAMGENGASGEQWRLFDYAWGANHPHVAVPHVDEIPEQYRKGFLGNMLPGLASAESQVAIDLFEGLEPGLQGQLRSRLYEGLIDNNIASATDYVYNAANPEKNDWQPMDTFARELANEQGLDATLAWAAELPEGALRGNAWSAAYAKWTSQDPHAAVQSIVDMPPSGDRNQAINGFISALAGQDPEAAVTWAAEISEPGMRESAMVRAGTQFFQQYPGAADAWFQSSDLPAAALGKMTPAN
jgi:hypothetical protein